MRKQPVNILLSVTMFFCVFLSGFFFGRNYNHAPIQVSALKAEVVASVPTVPAESSEANAEAISPSEAPVPAGLININTATVQQLETLPGIGEVIAQRIIDYRNTHGPFPSVYALTNVKGIGEKRLADLIHLITV